MIRDHRNSGDRPAAGPPFSRRPAAALACAAALLAALSPNVALAQDPAPAPRPTLPNAMCPVMTEEPASAEFMLEYHGKRVAFCCTRCIAKFEKNPERYLAHLPQFRLAAAEGTDPAGGDSRAGQDDIAPALDQMQVPQKRAPLLARIHPVLVHFPLAGAPLALLGFLIWRWTRLDGFAKADFPPLALAALTSVAAVITGNAAESSERFSVSLHAWVERHQLAGTSAMIALLLLTALRVWRWNGLGGRWSWVYGGALALVVLLLMAVGFLGGGIVYGPEHLMP